MCNQSYYLCWKVRVPFQLVMQRYDVFWCCRVPFLFVFGKCLFKLSWAHLYLRFLPVMECLMQAVEVAESFRLFATITTSNGDVSHALEGLFIWC